MWAGMLRSLVKYVYNASEGRTPQYTQGEIQALVSPKASVYISVKLRSVEHQTTAVFTATEK